MGNFIIPLFEEDLIDRDFIEFLCSSMSSINPNVAVAGKVIAGTINAESAISTTGFSSLYKCKKR